MPMYKSIRYRMPGETPDAEAQKGYKPVYQRVQDGEYEAKGDEGTKRMVRDEQTKMYQLLGLTDVIDRIMVGLNQRLQTIPKGIPRIKTAKSIVTKLAFDLLNTAPVEQRIYMRDQIQHIEIMTGIKAQMPRDPAATFGQFLNFNQLATVEKALREQCTLCTIEDPAIQARCEYAELLNVLPINKADEDAKGCGWFHQWDI